MANAKRCDRCGEFYITKSNTCIDCTTLNRLYLSKFKPAAPYEIMDLCCCCKHDLDEWFNKFNKEGANNEEDTSL